MYPCASLDNKKKGKKTMAIKQEIKLSFFYYSKMPITKKKYTPEFKVFHQNEIENGR
jgi:hypothetical protein